MRCKYLPQDLNARLHGGVAFYNNEPVLVHIENDQIHLQSFPKRTFLTKIKENDPLFDISSPNLGYVNDKSGCIYYYRRPERRYKQTLTTGCLLIFDPAANTTSPQVHMDIDRLENTFYSDGFVRMLTNSYPSLENAFSHLNANNKNKAKAINRNVALVKDSFGVVRVFYKTEEVGIIMPGETIVRVPKGENAWIVSKYLSEFNWVVE